MTKEVQGRDKLNTDERLRMRDAEEKDRRGRVAEKRIKMKESKANERAEKREKA